MMIRLGLFGLLLAPLGAIAGVSSDFLEMRALILEEQFSQASRKATLISEASLDENQKKDLSFMRSYSFFRTNDYVRAASGFAETRADARLGPFAEYFRLKSLFFQNKCSDLVSDAEKLYERWQKTETAMAAHLTMILGICYEQQGRALEAAKMFGRFDRKLSRKVDDEALEEIHLAEARVFAKRKRSDKAFELYRKIWVRSLNEDVRARVEQGLADLGKNKYQLDFKDYLARGRYLNRARRFDEGREYLSTLLFKLSTEKSNRWAKSPKERGTKVRSVLEELATGAMGSRDFVSTKLYLQKYLELDPENPEMLLMLSRVESRMDNNDAAKIILDKLQKTAHSPSLRNKIFVELYQLELKAGNWTDAIHYLERQLSITGQRGARQDILFQMAWLAWRTSDWAKGEMYLRQSLALSRGEQSSATYWLARTLEKKGEAQAAKELMEKLIGKTDYYGVMATAWLSAKSKSEFAPRLSELVQKLRQEAAREKTPNAEILREEDIKIFPPEWQEQIKNAQVLTGLGVIDVADEELSSLGKEVFRRRELVGPLKEVYRKLGRYHHLNRLVRTLYTEELEGESADVEIWKDSFPKAYDRHVENFSNEYQLDPYLVWAIMRQESSFNARAISPVGARGLLQIMPFTGRKIAAKLKNQKFQVSDLFQPRLNIQYGAWYMKYLLTAFQGDMWLSIMSYNAGPHIVSAWTKNSQNKLRAPASDMPARNEIPLDEFVEISPYRESRGYLRSVLKNYFFYRVLYDASFDYLSFLEKLGNAQVGSHQIQDI